MSALTPDPRHGPHHPLDSTLTRVPGSARRTSHTDMLRPDGPDGDLVLRAAGQDIVTQPDGAVTAAGAARLEVRVDFAGDRRVREIEADPRRPGLEALVGTVAGPGFRRKAARAVPGEAAGGSVLYQLLDDVPVTTLIAGYAIGAASPDGRHAADRGPGPGPTPATRFRTGPPPDLCAGFQSGGTMMVEIARYGSSPVSVGPAAPRIDAGDPDGWHTLPELPPLGMRRRRLLDVLPGPEDWQVRSWFRDTYRLASGEETVVHEYLVRARVTPGTWRVTAIEADPLVLPWTECPQAAPSARRLNGAVLPGLRDVVSVGFRGPSTCTHLNDELRSLADVPALARLVSASS